jgi:hypothetical protein
MQGAFTRPGRWLRLILFCYSLSLPVFTASGAADKSLPNAGLPVLVRTGLRYGQLGTIDEKEGSFAATVDLRLRWSDARLAYPKPDGAAFKEFKDGAAQTQLASMWAPGVEMVNTTVPPALRISTLRIYPDGQVEWMQRFNAKFATAFDPQRFPFDQQKLAVELAIRGEDQNRVALDFRQDDLDFSGASFDQELGRWNVGLTHIRRDPLPGLYGAFHSRLWVELQIERKFTMALAPIFIPLFASLLIPLMAIFMNRVTDGVFQIEAFSLSNIVIGGLFAVIALNFTVNSSYPTLGGTDNTVTRLFGLSYLAQGAALTIIILLFRFNMVRHTFGKYVQEQLFLCLIWTGPLLAIATAVAVLLVAMA